MREIKFRGFHVKTKKMYSAEELAKDQLTLLTTGEFINVSGCSTERSYIYPTDLFIPMQYTGLKDSTGKEIYEGDILGHSKYPEESPCYYMIIFENGCYRKYNKNWDKTLQKIIMTQENINLLKDIILGNIHQNKELLND